MVWQHFKSMILDVKVTPFISWNVNKQVMIASHCNWMYHITLKWIGSKNPLSKLMGSLEQINGATFLLEYCEQYEQHCCGDYPAQC